MKIGEQEGLMYTVLQCVLQLPQFIPKDQRFDLLVLVSAFCEANFVFCLFFFTSTPCSMAAIFRLVSFKSSELLVRILSKKELCVQEALAI